MFEITEYDVLTYSKGVYTPRAVYIKTDSRRYYAKVGTGFIKLKTDHETSSQSIRWECHTIHNPQKDTFRNLIE